MALVHVLPWGVLRLVHLSWPNAVKSLDHTWNQLTLSGAVILHLGVPVRVVVAKCRVDPHVEWRLTIHEDLMIAGTHVQYRLNVAGLLLREP